MPDPLRVFVSHHHSPDEDRFTARLVSHLQTAGIDVWVDNAITSDDFVQRISEGLTDRQWLVLVMSPQSVASPWVRREVNAALSETTAGRMCGVLPIVMIPCAEQEIPLLWRPLHRYDATNEYESARDGLLTAIGVATPVARPSCPTPRVIAYTPPNKSIDAAKTVQVSIKEFELPVKVHALCITPGPDNAMWFTSWGDKIGRISLTGHIQMYDVSWPDAVRNPIGITNKCIVAGPDGALWFTVGPSGIGRIDTAGRHTEYPDLATLSGTSITCGSDGALWVCGDLGPSANAVSTGALLRITTTGQFLAFPLPKAAGEPVSITEGSDGALWFTTSTNAIGRMSTAGKVRVFPLSHQGSGPHGIAAASDGALWFTESGGDRIGRITVTGEIIEYAVPKGCCPEGIASGPDRALWFTERSHNRIGRITVDGNVQEFRLQNDEGEPFDIAVGLDGTIWYTRLFSPDEAIDFNGIGRIRLR